MLTDLPTGAIAILKSEVAGRDYIRSLIDVNEEAVFSRQDPLPAWSSAHWLHICS